MIISLKARLVLMLLLLGSLPLCLAEAPSGQVNLAFNGANTALWDLSGGYQFDQEILGAGGQTIPLSFGLSFNQDARGFLKGADMTTVNIGNDFVAAQYTATGKISGGGLSPVRVSLLVRLSGQDVIAGKYTSFSITVTYALIIDSAGDLRGTVRGTAHLGKVGGGRITSAVSLFLPEGMSGSWGLQMNILPLKRLNGTATIVLSNGRTFSANLSGSYAAKTDLSRIQILGVGDSRGITLNLSLAGGNAQTLTGTALGLAVRR